MNDHWSDKKPHPFDPSLRGIGPFPRCVVCGFGPNHPLHIPTVKKAAA